MNNPPLLQVRLHAEYANKSVLNDICFDLQPGEVLGLAGTSGAGKSTLVLSLLGLLPWRGGKVAGQVLLNGKDLLSLSERELRKLRGRDIALIPQSPMTALNSAISLQTHFNEAWRAHDKRGQDVLEQRMRTLLRDVQLPYDKEFLRRKPSQISVGQAQRVLIALALLHGPSLIIADEPTSALDPLTQTQIVDLLKSVNRLHGTTLLYISHDLVSVLQLCDRMAVLDAGTIVETLALTELGQARRAATLALLKSLPVPPEVLLKYRAHKDRNRAEEQRLLYVSPPERSDVRRNLPLANLDCITEHSATFANRSTT